MGLKAPASSAAQNLTSLACKMATVTVGPALRSAALRPAGASTTQIDVPTCLPPPFSPGTQRRAAWPVAPAGHAGASPAASRTEAPGGTVGLSPSLGVSPV